MESGISLQGLMQYNDAQTRRWQPPRFFSSAISGTTLTTVSFASRDKAQCAIFTCAARFAHGPPEGEQISGV